MSGIGQNSGQPAAGSVSMQQPKRSLGDVIHNLQRTIQSYGPGPYSDEQSRELEKLNSLYAKAKAEYEKQVRLIQGANMASSQQQLLQQQPLYHVASTISNQAQIQTVGVLTSNTPGQPIPHQSNAAPQLHPQSIVIGGHKLTSYTPPAGQPLQITAQTMQASLSAGGPGSVTVQHLQGSLTAPQMAHPQSGVVLSASQPPGAMSQANTAASLAAQQQVKAASVQAQKRSLAPVPDASTHPPMSALGASVSGNAKTSLVNRADASMGQPVVNQLLSKRKLQDLLQEIDPLETMDEDVEEALLQIADDFIESVVTSSCQIAKHRKSSALEAKDVQLHLDRNWNMWVPGFGSEDLRPQKRMPLTDAHRQRLALIKKSLKK